MIDRFAKECTKCLGKCRAALESISFDVVEAFPGMMNRRKLELNSFLRNLQMTLDSILAQLDSEISKLQEVRALLSQTGATAAKKVGRPAKKASTRKPLSA